MLRGSAKLGLSAAPLLFYSGQQGELALFLPTETLPALSSAGDLPEEKEAPRSASEPFLRPTPGPQGKSALHPSLYISSMVRSEGLLWGLVLGTGRWTAFYIAPLSKRCTIYASHSPVHTHIHTPTAIGCHARHQPARQEQSGVRCLAQGHFDTPRVGSNRQPSDCQMTALTS